MWHISVSWRGDSICAQDDCVASNTCTLSIILSHPCMLADRSHYRCVRLVLVQKNVADACQVPTGGISCSVQSFEYIVSVCVHVFVVSMLSSPLA